MAVAGGNSPSCSSAVPLLRRVRRVAAAGWQVPAEPTMPRLNSQVLGF